MPKGPNEQAEEFRIRHLLYAYPILWVDALYENVCYGNHVVSMATLMLCGVNNKGRRKVLYIEPMFEESKKNYKQLFDKLKERGLCTPSLIISDAHSVLVSAIGESFPGNSWQRCNVHFMRNILSYVPHKGKERFVGSLKDIWTATDKKTSKRRAQELADEYQKKCSKAIEILYESLKDSLTFVSFSPLAARKVSSNNML